MLTPCVACQCLECYTWAVNLLTLPKLLKKTEPFHLHLSYLRQVVHTLRDNLKPRPPKAISVRSGHEIKALRAHPLENALVLTWP